jgi:dTDP-4-dehydrorhamnose 3,5-epimerase
MNVSTTDLPGVVIIEPDVFGDHRGFFSETYHADRYLNEAGIKETFVQDNHSRSGPNVLRGLHFQVKRPQGKLVRVTRGKVFDVAVDINQNSPTFLKWVGIELSEDNHRQFYVPPGYAQGFLTMSDTVDFQYKCTDYYDPTDEGGIVWNDPAIGIDWPLDAPNLSEKDKNHPTTDEYFR